jgi:hypothetical protein
MDCFHKGTKKVECDSCKTSQILEISFEQLNTTSMLSSTPKSASVELTADCSGGCGNTLKFLFRISTKNTATQSSLSSFSETKPKPRQRPIEKAPKAQKAKTSPYFSKQKKSPYFETESEPKDAKRSFFKNFRSLPENSQDSKRLKLQFKGDQFKEITLNLSPSDPLPSSSIYVSPTSSIQTQDDDEILELPSEDL